MRLFTGLIAERWRLRSQPSFRRAPVNVHQNARTTPYIRELMAVRRGEGWAASEIAEAAGVSVRTVYKWLTRFDRGGSAALAQRSSRPRRCPNRLADPLIAAIA